MLTLQEEQPEWIRQALQKRLRDSYFFIFYYYYYYYPNSKEQGKEMILTRPQT